MDETYIKQCDCPEIQDKKPFDPYHSSSSWYERRKAMFIKYVLCEIYWTGNMYSIQYFEPLI